MRTRAIPPASLASLLTCLLVACGGGDSPSRPTPVATPTPASRAQFTANISPDPVTATPNTAGTAWRVSYTLRISESAGLGGNVNYVNVSLTDICGQALPAMNNGANEIIRWAGTNHIAGRGSLSIPLAWEYYGCFRTQRVTFRHEVSLTDDRGNPHIITVGVSATHKGLVLD